VGGGVSVPLPDIVVHHSTAWAQVSPERDVAAWAPDAADLLWSASGQPYSALDVDILGAQLEVLGRSAFTFPCAGAFVFCPDLSRGPRAVLRLTPLSCRPGAAAEEIVDDLLLPAESQLPQPQVEHGQGAEQRHLRVRQRACSAADRAVYDHIAYVFPFPAGAWVLSTALTDPREAERLLPDLDHFAAGVRLQGCA
jgi:hypothetical protein